MNDGARAWSLAAATAAIVALVFAIVPPIPQDPGYHGFADVRAMAGIPNALNVLSNVPFVLVGLAGLWLARQRRLIEDQARGFPSYELFFASVALTGFGSAWYHWAPSNDTLVWDRLPLAISVASLTTATLAERIGTNIERHLLYPLVILAVFSVLYWYVTENKGEGDLRLYALVQLLPVLVITAAILLFAARFSRAGDLWLALALFVAAKFAENFDGTIMAAADIVSGHTLKHVLAAAAAWQVLDMLRKRVPRRP